MSEQAYQPARSLTRFAHVRERQPGSDLAIGLDSPDHRAPFYLYEAGHLLIAGRDGERRALLRAAVARIPGVDALVPAGRVPGRDPVGRYRVESSSGISVPEVMAEVDVRIPGNREIPVVTPNHVLTIAGTCLLPENEPVPVRQALPYPAPMEPSGPHSVAVYLADTGLVPAHTALAAGATWMAGVRGEPGPPYDPGDIPPYAGHGTFAGGIVGCLAPTAAVLVSADLRGGAVTEYDLCRGLRRVIGSGRVPDVIGLVAGAATRGGHPPLAMEAIIGWAELSLRRIGRPLLVVAAGDNASAVPPWPAGYAAISPSVLSVGALDQGQPPRRACFSNHGPWVKVYASGEKLVNVFPHGRYRYRHGPAEVCDSDALTPGRGETRRFAGGLARWSGTSLATPLVAGLIARRVARTGQSARQAAADVMAFARSQAGAGPLPAVLTADNEIV
ncbi:S8 family serine peptidase [Spongiactinospora sp. 9N601]|uniref:S8 family serine peptidase n=1 Tax=Spongiactinospora sp. 9N601 TaxID=3375149 RepID=UPI00378EADAC